MSKALTEGALGIQPDLQLARLPVVRPPATVFQTEPLLDPVFGPKATPTKAKLQQFIGTAIKNNSWGDLCKVMPSGAQIHVHENTKMLGTVKLNGIGYLPNDDRILFAAVRLRNAPLMPATYGTVTTQAARIWVALHGKAGDQAGHEIGRQFGGRGGLFSGNIFQQNAIQNMAGGGYYAEEMQIRRSRDANPKAVICMYLVFQYSDKAGVTVRPTHTVFIHTIDGVLGPVARVPNP